MSNTPSGRIGSADSFLSVGSNNPFNAQAISEHIISGSCSSYFSSAGQVYLTSNTSCEATTSLNRTVTLDVGELPSPTTLSSWSLQVQDWSPAILNATGTEGTETTKEWLPAVNITQLAAWPNITSLESASGVGVYLTSVNLTTPAQDVRILLSVGTVEGTYGLSVNGKNVSGIDQFGNRDYDITDLVVDGDNGKLFATPIYGFTVLKKCIRFPNHGRHNAVEQAESGMACGLR